MFASTNMGFPRLRVERETWHSYLCKVRRNILSVKVGGLFSFEQGKGEVSKCMFKVKRKGRGLVLTGLPHRARTVVKSP